MCTHVWTMNELQFNWEWTKIQQGMNLYLIKSEWKLIKNELKVNWEWTENELSLTRSELGIN
jgi:hypothetical protein